MTASPGDAQLLRAVAGGKRKENRKEGGNQRIRGEVGFLDKERDYGLLESLIKREGRLRIRVFCGEGEWDLVERGDLGPNGFRVSLRQRG